MVPSELSEDIFELAGCPYCRRSNQSKFVLRPEVLAEIVSGQMKTIPTTTLKTLHCRQCGCDINMEDIVKWHHARPIRCIHYDYIPCGYGSHSILELYDVGGELWYKRGETSGSDSGLYYLKEVGRGHPTLPNATIEQLEQDEQREQDRVDRHQKLTESCLAIAWQELEDMLGIQAARLLKSGSWWGFQGSNGEKYGICGRDAELVNDTRRRRYCVQVNAGTLSIADEIMIKVKWCLEDAENVERIKEDNGSMPNALHNRLNPIVI